MEIVKSSKVAKKAIASKQNNVKIFTVFQSAYTCSKSILKTTVQCVKFIWN